MKTIAISIEESMLRALRELAGTAGKPRGPDDPRSISAIVREALRDYLARREKAAREASDRTAFARHRDRLRSEAEALVGGQAKP
jgi:metal-responsive CopG/Arc/MetJ family transcriptional regulator